MSGSYGINFLNADGSKIISEDYVNISVDQTYRFTSTTIYEKTYKLSDAVLFAVSKGSGGAIIKNDFDENTKSIRYKIIVAPFHGTESGEFRIYRKIPLTNKSNHGLVVKNKKSEPVFSSENEVLNVTDLISMKGIENIYTNSPIFNDGFFIYPPNQLVKNWSLSYCKNKIEEKGYIYVSQDSSASSDKYRMLPSFKIPGRIDGDYCVFNVMPIYSIQASGKSGRHSVCPYAPFVGIAKDGLLQFKATYPDSILQDISNLGTSIHTFIFSATAKIPIGTSLSDL